MVTKLKRQAFIDWLVLEPGDLTWLPNVTKLDASEKVGVGFWLPNETTKTKAN